MPMVGCLGYYKNTNLKANHNLDGFGDTETLAV